MIPFFSRKASRHGRTCWLCPNIVYIHEATAVGYQTKRRTSESTRQKKAVSGGKRNQENAAEAHILLRETTIQLVTCRQWNPDLPGWHNGGGNTDFLLLYMWYQKWNHSFGQLGLGHPNLTVCLGSTDRLKFCMIGGKFFKLNLMTSSQWSRDCACCLFMTQVDLLTYKLISLQNCRLTIISWQLSLYLLCIIFS